MVAVVRGFGEEDWMGIREFVWGFKKDKKSRHNLLNRGGLVGGVSET